MRISKISRVVTIVVFIGMIMNFSLVGAPIKQRWFRSQHNVANEKQKQQLIRLLRNASKHGYNGVLLSTGFANFNIDQSDTRKGLLEVKKVCDELKMDLIPCVPGVGWGEPLFQRNPPLIAGLPVKGSLLEVRNGKAVLISRPVNKVVNGDLEKYSGNTFADFILQVPGKETFVDTSVTHSGNASLRMQNFSGSMCRIGQLINVTPQHAYRFSSFSRQENLKSAKDFAMYVYKPDDLNWPPLPYMRFNYNPVTGNWRQKGYIFNSLDYSKVNIFVGMWSIKKNDPGKLWIDDIRVEEMGPQNAVRRSGTPIKIIKVSSEKELVAGRDYVFVENGKPRLQRYDWDGATIKILPDGPAKLKDGDKLRADWYQPVSTSWPHICMSEPGTYKIWDKWFKLIHKYLKPKHYLLSMDEIRGGCTCNACKSRGISNGEILSDCVNRQYKMIKKLDPEAKVLVWGDMFDPNHNAKPGDYYWVKGGFNGSWKKLNKNIIIACWGDKISDATFKHFSDNGFKVMGATYYDTGNLDGSRECLKKLKSMKNAYGIMYTTWGGDYDRLVSFGDMVRE